MARKQLKLEITFENVEGEDSEQGLQQAFDIPFSSRRIAKCRHVHNSIT